MFFNKKRTQQKVQQIRDQVESSQVQLEPILTEITDKTDKLTSDVKDATDKHLLHLSKQVKDKPIKAVVISAIVGYLLGRITR